MNYTEYDQLSTLTPPHSIEAEQSVIGGLLIDQSALDDVMDVISTADFFRPSHQLIFSVITDLKAMNKPVDLVLVAEELTRRGDVSEAGGIAYLAEVAGNTPSTANIIGYAWAIRDRSQERAMITAASEIQDFARDPDITMDEKLSKAQQRVLEIGETAAEKQLYGTAGLQAWMESLTNRHEAESTFGLSTSLKSLNYRYHGLQDNHLVILAARPAMGKSTLAFQVAAHAATTGNAAMVFSMEMSRNEIYDKVACTLGGINSGRMRKGELEGDDWNSLTSAVNRLKSAPLYIDDRASLHINQIAATCRRMHRKSPLRLVVVDYIQLARGDGNNRTEQIGHISRSLKALAKELSCPVLALSQLNRGVEQRTNKRPMASDLRESGEIEQDADAIIFIYRDEVYNEQTEHKGIAELITAKWRHGEVGTDYVHADLAHSRFLDLERPVPVITQPDKKLASSGMDY